MRQGTRLAELRPAATSVWPFSVASIASTACGGSFDRFARVSLRTAPVAVGASQVGRHVLAALHVLVHVRLVNSDYVNPALLTWHSQNNTRLQSIHEGDTFDV